MVTRRKRGVVKRRKRVWSHERVKGREKRGLWSHEREKGERGPKNCLILMPQLTTLTRLTRSLKNDPGLQGR